MNEQKILARVLLRPNGSVHIAFGKGKTVYATAENVFNLFSAPMEFIENEGDAAAVSTTATNRKHLRIEDIPGLTLATIDSDKRILCEFPELFRAIFANSEDEKQCSSPLNMKFIKYEKDLPDEKSYLLRFYLELTNSLTPEISIQRNIKIRPEVQLEIMRESLNTFFDEHLPKPIEDSASPKLEDRIAATTEDVLVKSYVPQYVSVVAYAQHYNYSCSTVRKYAKSGQLKSAKKEKGKWLIDINDVPDNVDLRKDRKVKKKSKSYKAFKQLKGSNAEAVQAYIRERKLFTEKVAPFMRTSEEVQYYEERSYHEVLWDGRSALIIDVNPDYTPEGAEESNRDRMLAGKPPVVPEREKDSFIYHLHHVGQLPNSPFAIIPQYIHNGKEYFKVFHPASSDTKDLHGIEFEAEKRNFWKTYIEKYDEAGSFKKIAYLNSKHKKDKR